MFGVNFSVVLLVCIYFASRDSKPLESISLTIERTYRPQAAIVHTCEGAFQSSYDTSELHWKFCNASSNISIEFLLGIMAYLSYVFSNFHRSAPFLLVLDMHIYIVI